MKFQYWTDLRENFAQFSHHVSSKDWSPVGMFYWVMLCTSLLVYKGSEPHLWQGVHVSLYCTMSFMAVCILISELPNDHSPFWPRDNPCLLCDLIERWAFNPYLQSFNFQFSPSTGIVLKTELSYFSQLLTLFFFYGHMEREGESAVSFRSFLLLFLYNNLQFLTYKRSSQNEHRTNKPKRIAHVRVKILSTTWQNKTKCKARA